MIHFLAESWNLLKIGAWLLENNMTFAQFTWPLLRCQRSNSNCGHANFLRQICFSLPWVLSRSNTTTAKKKDKKYNWEDEVRGPQLYPIEILLVNVHNVFHFPVKVLIFSLQVANISESRWRTRNLGVACGISTYKTTLWNPLSCPLSFPVGSSQSISYTYLWCVSSIVSTPVNVHNSFNN